MVDTQRLVVIVGAALVLAVLPGISSGQAPQPTAPAPAAPAVTPPAAPGAPAEGAARGARDPFDPLITKPVETVAPGAPPEQRQPLSGIKLVGVIWDARDQDRIRALVETPEGLGYYVRMNEEKFGGKVVAIERDRVRFSVREQIPGGPVRVRTVELKLGGE